MSDTTKTAASDLASAMSAAITRCFGGHNGAGVNLRDHGEVVEIRVSAMGPEGHRVASMELRRWGGRTPSTRKVARRLARLCDGVADTRRSVDYADLSRCLLDAVRRSAHSASL